MSLASVARALARACSSLASRFAPAVESEPDPWIALSRSASAAYAARRTAFESISRYG